MRIQKKSGITLFSLLVTARQDLTFFMWKWNWASSARHKPYNIY